MTYTHGHHHSVLDAHATRTATGSAAYLLPHLRPQWSLLDVGSGPGTITLDLAEVVSSVTGVESSEAAIDAARANARERGDTTTTFQLGDAHALPFPDASFDVVHAHQVFHHLADPVRAMREMGRVCRPGGLVAVREVDYGPMTWFPASDGISKWLEVYRTLARANGAEPDAGRRLRSWANEAGFQQVRASASVWCYATTEETAWWGNSQADRVANSSFAEQAGAHGLATAEELREMTDAWRSWGADPDAWFVMVHGEILATVD